MKPVIAFVIIALISFVICCSSEDGPTENINSSNQLAGVNHLGCKGLMKVDDEYDYLKSFFVYKDTLYLKIHFTANCCPEFIDSVYFEPGLIQVFSNDILHECRCFCPYEDEYKVIYPFSGMTKIEFWRDDDINPEYHLAFATYINLP